MLDSNHLKQDSRSRIFDSSNQFLSWGFISCILAWIVPLNDSEQKTRVEF